MSTIAKHHDPESNPRIKAVFDDIRATRKSDFINNMWHYLAFDADLLETTWAEVKAVMATPSALDPLVKEMLYIAVRHQWLRLLCTFAYGSRQSQGHDGRTARRSAACHRPGRQDQPARDRSAAPRRSNLRCRSSTLIAAKKRLSPQASWTFWNKSRTEFWPFGSESLH